ncbi:S8 family serine peptidase [Actinomycetes bacterium KLBMP 9797]
MSGRSVMSCVLIAALLAAGPPPSSASAAPAPAPEGYAVAERIADVTLVTGDVVTVGREPGGALTAEVTGPAPRPDGRGVLYSTVREGDALYVYPADALGPVTAGRLDRRLFDVAYLASNGYADAAAPTLPVIVQYPPSVRAATDLARRADALPASDDTATLASVHAAAVAVEKPKAEEFWAAALDSGAATVWLDGRATATLDASVPQIGAPAAWAAGYDGTGVTVAVLDTGVDETHPDLAGRVRAARSFIPGQTRDGHGHGTHVASIVAGGSDRYRGVAPGVTLLAGKVLNDAGTGTESQIIAGMQWAVGQGADVVNMSLGGCCTDGTDPMSQAVNRLTAESGALFVVAAGNDGARGSRTVGAPGVADAALTVAAVDGQDRMAPFSSRGPRPGDFGRKPDIAAPGVGITAARAAGTSMGSIVDETHTSASGTSMATPHVAGAAAILAQRHPDWTAAQLKDGLMSTAVDTGAGGFAQGAGRVDAARAVRQDVRATGGVDFGRVPYTGAAVERTVTYTNDTDRDVTLNLSTSIAARTGAAPANALRVDRTTVTVPAKGSASVVAAFDPSAGPDTWYHGAIRARADGVALTTVVGGFREMKRVALTARVIPPDGAGQIFYGGWVLLRVDGRDEAPVYLESESGVEMTGQLDAGRYAVRTYVEWRDAAGAPHGALVSAPDVDVSDGATVVFDLRRATRLTASTPRASESYAHQFGFENTGAGGTVSLRSEIRAYGEMTLWTLPTTAPSVGEFYAYSQQVRPESRLTMRARGRLGTLDARYPPANITVSDDGIARFDGRQRLSLVYAGSGTSFADLDVRGKLVLLDLSDICAATCKSNGLDRVRAAANAGAAGVLGFGAVGRGFLSPAIYGGPSIWPAYPVPTLSLPTDQGAALRDTLTRGPVEIDVIGTRTPDYLYALTFPWEGRIPSTPIRPGSLYQIDNRIHADGPGAATLSFNAQLPGTGEVKRIGNGNSLRVSGMPGVVTTYLGPVNKRVGWFHGASFSYDNVDSVRRPGGWSDSEIEEFTRPGHRVRELGEQPLVSNTTRYTSSTGRYFTRTCLSCRNGDMFNPVHVLDSDGMGGGSQAYDISDGFYGDKQTELKLYRNGVEVPPQTGIVWIAPPWIAYKNVYYTLPPERATYRLTEKHYALAGMQRWARTVSTEWTFTSERPTTGFRSTADGGNCMGWYITWPNPPDVCQPTNQLFVGYDLGLRLDNTLPAHSVQRVTLSAYHSVLLDRAPRVTGMELWTSVDDGAHWSRVRTQPLGDGRFAATIVHPGLSHTTGAVSLRARAVDAAGNTVDQTIHRAYALR